MSNAFCRLAGGWGVGALLLLLALGVQARTVTGWVTGVSDGDTFYILMDGASTRVRLSQVDAPEKAQPFGRQAAQALRALVGQQCVTVSWDKVDRYGRPLVRVISQGLDVNAELVKRGFAWVYRQYATDGRLYAAEDAAQKAHLGLWADPHPVPPWEWRKAHKAGD